MGCASCYSNKVRASRPIPKVNTMGCTSLHIRIRNAMGCAIRNSRGSAMRRTRGKIRPNRIQSLRLRCSCSLGFRSSRCKGRLLHR